MTSAWPLKMVKKHLVFSDLPPSGCFENCPDQAARRKMDTLYRT